VIAVLNAAERQDRSEVSALLCDTPPPHLVRANELSVAKTAKVIPFAAA
jgi:hypothetical protein